MTTADVRRAPVAVQCGAATDRGLRRRLNEDSYLAQAPLFLVADGMGGHQAGEVASATAVDAFAPLVGRDAVGVDEMRAAFERARRAVEALPEGTGARAGTTLTGAAVADVDGEGYWLVINIGDSRTYRLSDGILEQISVDHSIVQELVDRGELDQAQAAQDSRRNVITRALGAGSDGEPDYWLIPAEEGDRLLVCSDGLPGELGRDRIDEILRAETHPQRAATRLVEEAVRHGGRDNVTALVVDAISVGGAGRSPRAGTQPVLGALDEDDEDTMPRARRPRNGGRE